MATFLRQAAGLECTTGVRLHGGRRVIRINKKNAVTPVTQPLAAGDDGDGTKATYSERTQFEGMWTGPAEVVL